MPSGTEPETLALIVDGRALRASRGQTVASALLAAGIVAFRRSPSGGPRGAFCMMGACQECAILIGGRIARACQTEAVDGMRVSLRGASAE